MHTGNISSACPGARQLCPLFMLQVHEVVAFQLMSLHARSGPGFEAKLRQLLAIHMKRDNGLSRELGL
jgi:hypothetical protein